ncbi:MAG: phosphoribosylformylglycinamidine synthase subunit PurL [Candidatus Muirbacterium halophilum]|nr:phosphoribosylformylglycinamidine synthase subunit PurL [Candidatus Muirbacterium halophilum]MCK9474929.1 phosphoribosylformylglycinamidine synthase subunit PurL [Candidatus Muirbacterium halophilum]
MNNSADYIKMGLTHSEWQLITKKLGRIPNRTETGIISVMWSEHCSYKNSRIHLKRFPVKGDCILQGPGENAGIVDFGDDIAITFKIESHNHPSAVEPYEGAATGVGGILRDIFTMGARPIAVMDSLRFGNMDNPKNRHIFEGVISGISGYGNCVGIPTVGGETYFDECYNENPLVNVLACGVMKKNDIRKGIAQGKDNPVYIVGSSTGRDGIHGATFASDELSDNSIDDRSSVQAGDPFGEKMVMEACLELYKYDYIIGIQDMGAAGITCSTFEMSHRGNAGMEIELSLVPQRELNMDSYDIMLSESQERMLVVVKPEYEKEFIEIFQKWDVHVEKIGKVIDEKIVKVFHNGKLEACLPVDFVVDGFPVYNREYKIPEYIKNINSKNNFINILEGDFSESFKKMLGSPNIISKKNIWTQYDYEVGLRTIVKPGKADASVLKLKESSKLVALSTDCNSRYCYINPFIGAERAVLESARNIICTGGKPLAITDGLNFGNPMDAEVFWQFKYCIDGIINACENLNTPVTGGNVSFYNQNKNKAIYPTPIIGMLGIVDKIENIKTLEFSKGKKIGMLGKSDNNIGGSEFLKVIYQKVLGPLTNIDWDYEKKLNNFILENLKMFSSLHDVSDGGLAIALFESAYYGKTGIKVNIETDNNIEKTMFSETSGRVIFCADNENFESLRKLSQTKNIPFTELGICEGDNFKINNFEFNMKEISKIFERGIL